MCIAILKPDGIKIEKDVLKNCFQHHYDGAGFAYHNPKKNTLVVKKGFFTFEEFWAAYKPYQHLKMLVHFRWATHGEYNEDNCHPFQVNENLAFIHNGVIKEVRQWDKNFSDTWHFNEAILKPIANEHTGIVNNEVFRLLLEDYISNKSKLIFLDNEGNHQIVNEAAGVWDSGCWFSNDSYEKPFEKKREHKNTTTTTTTTTTVKNTTEMSTKFDANWHGKKGINAELEEYYTANTLANVGAGSYEVTLETLFQECEQQEINNLTEVADVTKFLN